MGTFTHAKLDASERSRKLGIRGQAGVDKSVNHQPVGGIPLWDSLWSPWMYVWVDRGPSASP